MNLASYSLLRTLYSVLYYQLSITIRYSLSSLLTPLFPLPFPLSYGVVINDFATSVR
jgi:hypothetical protein